MLLPLVTQAYHSRKFNVFDEVSKYIMSEGLTTDTREHDRSGPRIIGGPRSRGDADGPPAPPSSHSSDCSLSS